MRSSCISFGGSERSYSNWLRSNRTQNINSSAFIALDFRSEKLLLSLYFYSYWKTIFHVNCWHTLNCKVSTLLCVLSQRKDDRPDIHFYSFLFLLGLLKKLCDSILKSDTIQLTSDVIDEFVALGSMTQRLLSLVTWHNPSAASKIGTSVIDLLKTYALKCHNLPLPKGESSALFLLLTYNDCFRFTFYALLLLRTWYDGQCHGRVNSYNTCFYHLISTVLHCTLYCALHYQYVRALIQYFLRYFTASLF